MSQMTPEVSKLLERPLALSIEEQEALAYSLISNLGGKIDEGVVAAWDAEIARRIQDARFRHSQDSSLGRHTQAKFGEAAACPLILWSFTRKPAPNTMLPLTGVWSAVLTPPPSSTPN